MMWFFGETDDDNSVITLRKKIFIGPLGKPALLRLFHYLCNCFKSYESKLSHLNPGEIHKETFKVRNYPDQVIQQKYHINRT